MSTQRPIKSLSDLMDGGVEERFNAALAEVWENVTTPTPTQRSREKSTSRSRSRPTNAVIRATSA